MCLLLQDYQSLPNKGEIILWADPGWASRNGSKSTTSKGVLALAKRVFGKMKKQTKKNRRIATTRPRVESKSTKPRPTLGASESRRAAQQQREIQRLGIVVAGQADEINQQRILIKRLQSETSILLDASKTSIRLRTDLYEARVLIRSLQAQLHQTHTRRDERTVAKRIR